MAQIIPPITSLPSDSGAAPSVEDIQDRLPSICVDYLSHDWSEEDVWASWRNMTRHKHEIANGVRLENASWRTWQKQRNNLKTISPETLNWLKDSDVTWLYGPLHTANVEPVRPLKVSSTDDRLGIDRPNPDGPIAKKPILKHRTLSEMLQVPMPSSPVLEATHREDELEGVDTESERPILLQSRSDTNIVTSRTHPVVKDKSPLTEKPPPAVQVQSLPAVQSPGSVAADAQASASKKHISFNTFVEQCVAVDEPREAQQLDSSDDEMLEMRSSSYSSSSRSSRPSLSRNSSTGSEHITIAMIAPTMLKTNNVQGGTALQYAPPPEYQSPGLNSNHSGGFDFPSPHVDSHTGKWADHDEDEDEYGSVGFDYFGGPNLSGNGEEDRKSNAQPIPSHVASSSYGRNAPTVNQPPPQPKWRQNPPSTSVEPSSVSSNSSSSSSLNVTSPPQPSRSILKVRSPNNNTQALSPEPSSPPLAYFNYNPSAATGIGGMRGSGSPYDYPGPTGSPITSPTVASSGNEERGRGRTTSRDRTLNDRSTSRGTSASSTGSLGSNSSVRSPTEGTSGSAAAGAAGGSGNSSASSSSQSLRKVQSPPQLDRVQEGVSWQPTPTQNEQSSSSTSSSGPNYVPDRSNTPTPHSSPQISLRPLKDTSPASLPHTSTSSRPSDLPKADPPTTVSQPHHHPQSRTNSGGRATIAHVGTNAQPTLSQPVDDDDGASIMGRAANIANTAKDLLGALWYGNESERVQGGQSQGQGQGQGQSQTQSQSQNLFGRQPQGNRAQGGSSKGHRRGASLG
ncbi:hypothetical protein I317_07773 [Kwoniella heveanensis CBS 569]|nr:hypothetical protein I317_07773 [Kwoniella heveanensis CBS 569]